MTHTTHTEMMTITLPLGRLAAEYGVPLEDGLEEYVEADVEIYADDDGEWCVHCRELPELSAVWAPQTEEMVTKLRSASTGDAADADADPRDIVVRDIDDIAGRVAPAPVWSMAPRPYAHHVSVYALSLSCARACAEARERAQAQAQVARVFFDEHGRPWSPCSSDHPAAESVGPMGCARPRGDVSHRRHWPARWIFWDAHGWNWALPRSGCANCGAVLPDEALSVCLECSPLILGDVPEDVVDITRCAACRAIHEHEHEKN